MVQFVAGRLRRRDSILRILHHEEYPLSNVGVKNRPDLAHERKNSAFEVPCAANRVRRRSKG